MFTVRIVIILFSEKWAVIVETGTEEEAGTNAKVSIQLYSKNGSHTGKIELKYDFLLQENVNFLYGRLASNALKKTELKLIVFARCVVTFE